MKSANATQGTLSAAQEETAIDQLFSRLATDVSDGTEI